MKDGLKGSRSGREREGQAKHREEEERLKWGSMVGLNQEVL